MQNPAAALLTLQPPPRVVGFGFGAGATSRHVGGDDDCWEDILVSPPGLRPTDVLIPFCDHPFWTGNMSLRHLLAQRQAEYDAAVAVGSDLAIGIILRQIFFSLQLRGASDAVLGGTAGTATRFLVEVDHSILRLAGCPSDREYWAITGDDIALAEIRVELERGGLLQQQRQQQQQQQHQKQQQTGTSFGLADAVLAHMDSSRTEEEVEPNDENAPILRQSRCNGAGKVVINNANNEVVFAGAVVADACQPAAENTEAIHASAWASSSISGSRMPVSVSPSIINVGGDKGGKAAPSLASVEIGLNDEREVASRTSLTSAGTNLYQAVEREEKLAPTHSSDNATADKKRKLTDSECAAAIKKGNRIQRSRKRRKRRTTIRHGSPKPPLEALEVPAICLGRCVPIELPSDTRTVAEMDERAIVFPSHDFLVNFPENHSSDKGHSIKSNESRKNPIVETKGCVMCGMLLPVGSTRSRNSNIQVIPPQNKGLCNHCDVSAWLFVDSDVELEIKWCKGCKNFQPWAFWGNLRKASKCKPCRDLSKARYAAMKETVGGFVRKKELPQGVYKVPSGKFKAETCWRGKYRYVGTFDTLAQASAAYVSVRKAFDDAKLSSCGAEVDVILNAAKKKVSKAMGGFVKKKKNELPQGVYKIPSGKFETRTSWGGKRRYIGNFDTPEQASAAYQSVKKDLDDAKVSSFGADEEDVIFDAAKKKAVEAVGRIVPKEGLLQ